LWILYLEYILGKDGDDPESLHLLCDHHQAISKWGVISKKPVRKEDYAKVNNQ